MVFWEEIPHMPSDDDLSGEGHLLLGHDAYPSTFTRLSSTNADDMTRTSPHRDELYQEWKDGVLKYNWEARRVNKARYSVAYEIRRARGWWGLTCGDVRKPSCVGMMI